VLEVGSGTKFQLLPYFHIVGPPSGSIKELGSASQEVVDIIIDLQMDILADPSMDLQVNILKTFLLAL
jgi:hypothetical protein